MKNLSIKEKCIDIPTPRVENIDDLDDIELTENSNSIESEDVKSNFCQCSVDGFSFVPTAKTTKILPAGYYTIEMSQQIGYFFNKQNVITNKLYRLPNKAVDTIMDDIDKFWSIKENYIKYNRVYRRNYLLYSAPGTGKTSLINLMCQDLIKKYNGIVVSIRNENDIYYYHPIMKMFRTIEPDRKMIVIIEDIDNFVSDRYSSRSSLETTLLNILDGNFKFDNTVIIATTNYPENLAEEYLTLDVKQSDPLSVTVNLDRAPFEAGASLKAFELAKKISENINGNYVYLSPLGCEGAYLYSGLGLMASQGQVLACGKAFAFTPFAKTTSQTQCEILKAYDEILKALAMGIMDYMSESASHGIALSLSGGADSALCATAVFYMALCALEDLGPQGLVSKLHELKIYVPLCKEDEDPLDYLRSEVMPKLLVTVYQGSENSGEVTFNAAKDLALFLGASHFSWSIAKVVNDYLKLYDDLGIGEKLSWDKDDLALQNIQARVRLPGIWLVANREGRLLLATSNLSEASVGYCTMDGDTAGGLSPIAGIGKSVVRKINAYLEEVGLLTSQGRFKVKALDKVNAQAPTAELRPGGTQTDERDLMPYVLLDAIRKALSLNVRVQDLIATIKQDPACQDFADSFIKENLERYFRLHARSQWKRERFATGFHIEHDDASPESYLHLPIFTSDLKALSAYL